jgi:uncharacterized protein YwqG
VPSTRDLLTTFDLARIAADVEAAAKPSIYLSSGEESEDPSSRLGGRPNLPESVEWPVWEDLSLAFIAQLDLSGLPKLDSFPLPAQGSLLFFYEGGENAWGFAPKDKGSAQVIYSPEPLTNHPIRDFPEDILDEQRFTPVRLHAAPGVSLPDTEDQLLDDLALNLDERERYFEFLEAWRQRQPAAFHRIGGYPEPIQGDPKLEAHLVSHGLYCGNASGYQKGKELGLYPGAKDWELLFQIDSDEAGGMMWGDLGRLYFLMRSADIAAQSFDKAWMVFQCS